ncbi:hypothetical protein [Nocardia veterana]|uniref:Uncharacterized protein n=1 Tax=Nocardia veterana TaxID=132249 RepID=A0A7X6M2W1_9NOCA|nr:hypothetical protein [Nocardia veterana]NKY89295.1 hypothetical protein [Nocardia veterana]
MLGRRAGDPAIDAPADRLVTVGSTVSGPGAVGAASILGVIAGVVRIDAGDDEED